MAMTGYRPLPVVPDGPRAFRYRIRRRGPLIALAPAAALGVVAGAALLGSTSSLRGIIGFAAAVLAAPALLAFGVPLASGAAPRALGIVVSAVLWLALGAVAARRATRSPVATWRDFWREFAWLGAGAWFGVGAALLIVQVAVGGALL